ncbi:MAG: ABC transporter permease, partial [Bacteroidales bacterium]|nr:ABC transporter permease [Bacteroidales bacterium]
KVMGASFLDIIKLLSKTYIILIIIANLVAWPIGYIAMHRWLQDFAYRINFGVGLFLLTGLIALMIVIIAVSSQAIKASLTNPVESLRYE